MNYWNMRSVVKLVVLMALASSVHLDPGIGIGPVEKPSSTDCEEKPADNSLPSSPGEPPIPRSVFLKFVKNVITKEKHDIVSECSINATDDKTQAPNLSEDDYKCSNASHCFTKCERKYIDKYVPTEEEPSPTGPETKKLQKKVYAKEVRQRPFECIGNRTDGSSTVLTGLNPKYLALACSCAKKQPAPICDPSYKYRSIDGTCNNLVFTKWGSSLSCLQRFVPPSYEGVSGFRQSVCGKALPDARTASLEIYMDQDRPNKDMSHMAVFYGQFVAHDITDVSTSFVCTQPIDCCSNPGGKNQHPQCAPIIISKNDPFYSKYNVTCINFVRAAPCDNCDIGKRNQINQVTSYIDLSPVYGLDDEQAKSLRSKDGDGTLKCREKNGEVLLPPNPNVDIPGGCGRNHETCFLAGDRRANMHTPLMSLHTLFLREHNRIAKELSKYNPSWDDETLYQEARRINICQMQYITYKEYLKLLLAPYLMTLYGLYTTAPSVYLPVLDATGWAEVNGAAYRLHSALNAIVAEQGCAANRLLRNSFNDAEPLYNGNMTSLMNGICQTPAQQNDKFVTKEMTDYMYKTLKGYFGLDIAAFNIQRGRDLGLPCYVDMAEFWSLGAVKIKTFDDLSVYMDESNIKVLKKIYCDVRDIDLWVGLTYERPDGDTLLGPTAARMVGFQFFAMKYGDRFFFQHIGNLDPIQFAEVKKTSFAGLMCQNTKIKRIQKNAFMAPCDTNPTVDCDDIPKMDLSCWTKASVPDPKPTINPDLNSDPKPDSESIPKP